MKVPSVLSMHLGGIWHEVRAHQAFYVRDTCARCREKLWRIFMSLLIVLIGRKKGDRRRACADARAGAVVPQPCSPGTADLSACLATSNNDEFNFVYLRTGVPPTQEAKEGPEYWFCCCCCESPSGIG
eukprot:297198-Amphidinium_carterae.1